MWVGRREGVSVTERDRSTAEEVVRALAGAVNAVRLYPPSSELPGQALDRLVEHVARATAGGTTLRLLVDPEGFRHGDVRIAEGHTQSLALAENLHAMQTGQVIFAPEATRAELESFVTLIAGDPREIRAQGGPRSLLTAAGVTRVAVLEVTLRASSEEGLPGLDLANAPLDDIAQETLAAARRWTASAEQGTAGDDEAARAIGSLEQATRDLAASRIAQALMRLDDDERVEVLTATLRPGQGGVAMTGMLDIVARMNPSALARLLKLAAVATGGTPELLASRLELPPEILQELTLLLSPPPRTEAECGVPQTVEPERLAEEASAPGGESDVARLVADAPVTQAGRALNATIAVLRERPEVESVKAVGEALAPAARAGSLTTVREALRLLDEVSADPALSDAAVAARTDLSDPGLLGMICETVRDDADAAITGEILAAAGPTGAEVLLTHVAHANPHSRSLFRPVVRGMSDQVLAVAGRRLRSDDAATAVGILSVLPDLGDRQAVPVVTSALEHLDISVRRTAVSTLADIPSTDARRSLARALGHWDPETRRWAISEVGRAKAVEALPTLVRILEDINIFERNHELKKEVIKCLESLGSRDALPILRRWSRRRFILGQKNKELRFLAERAVERLSAGEPEKE